MRPSQRGNGMLPTLIAMQSPNDLNGRVTNCLGFRILYPIRPCCHASRSRSLSWEYLRKSRFLAHRISDENLAERQGSDLSTVGLTQAQPRGLTETRNLLLGSNDPTHGASRPWSQRRIRTPRMHTCQSAPRIGESGVQSLWLWLTS